MLPKHFLAFLLPIITIATHATQTPTIRHRHKHDPQAIQKPPSLIITASSSLNITDLLTHKNPDSLRVNHNTYRLGDTTFHSLAFSLREEWQFALRGYYNLARFTAESESSVDCLPGLIWVQGDQLYARLVTGMPCEPQINTFSLGSVEVGRWHVVSVLVKWGVEGTGELHLWVDGVKVLEERGVDTIMDGDDGRVFRFESCGLGRCLGV